MPDINLDDTIAAIATPPGESGIALIRLSGPEAVSIANGVFKSGSGKPAVFQSHRVHYGKICGANGKFVDHVYLSFFQGPRSYTGQDIVEISSHGGLFISRTILNLLIQGGARHAEPGEFTKRAFLNGKIDLLQAEAVIDLIKARSEKSAGAALAQLSGSLGATFQNLKQDILKMMAHIEAFLDFPDEHLEVYSDQEFIRNFDRVTEEIQRLLAGFRRGSLLREGVCVVLAGPPNAGKSSLFNALLERDRAIVSEHPGTTRDILEEAIELEGLYLRLVDTAGIVEARDPVERLGVQRTQETLKRAYLLLCVLDASVPMNAESRKILEQVRESGKPFLICLNKCDLSPLDSDLDQDALRISARTREGFEALEKNIVKKIFEAAGEMESEQITRLRHKNALEECAKAVERARKSFLEQRSLEFPAADLKAALDFLRELVGEIYSEDLLNVIFSEFCIGK